MGNRPELVAIFSDFGIGSHYVAQVQARLLQLRVTQPVVQLCSDAPRYNARASAYLLASFLPCMPEGTLFIAVVDPGVGGDRQSILLQTERYWFVGPDNGLLSQVVARANAVHAQTLELPGMQGRSKTFDGRDLFAPAAAAVCKGMVVEGRPVALESLVGSDWPAHLPEIIYLDSYGNGVTGIASEGFSRERKLIVNDTPLAYAETFSAVAVGHPFWYLNANGLVEVAVNRGSAAGLLQLEIGMPVRWLDP